MGAMHEAIKRLARHFDERGQKDRRITVVGSRAYIRQVFKPKKRGGPLYIGEHELQLKDRGERVTMRDYDQPDLECVQAMEQRA